jgi:hypothetical protein
MIAALGDTAKASGSQLLSRRRHGWRARPARDQGLSPDRTGRRRRSASREMLRVTLRSQHSPRARRTLPPIWMVIPVVTEVS